MGEIAHIKSVIDFPRRGWTVILTMTGCISVLHSGHLTFPILNNTYSQSRRKISLFMFRNIAAFYFYNNLAGPLSHH